MAQFIATIRKETGIEEVRVSAQTKELAHKFARRYGDVVRVKGLSSFSLFKRGMRAEERFLFLQKLAMMLKSRAGEIKSLEEIRDSYGGPLSRAAEGLLEFVRRGEGIAAGIAADGKNFPALTAMAVQAGAETGSLVDALSRAAEYENEVLEIKQGTVKGVLLGLFWLAVSSIGCFVTIYHVGPMILEKKFFERLDPVDISMWENLGIGWGVFGGLFVALGLFVMLMATVGRYFSPVGAEKILSKIPVARKMVMAQHNYVTLSRLSLLFQGGVATTQALQSAIEGAQEGLLREELKACLKIAKLGKEKWQNSLKSLHRTDRLALCMAEDGPGFAELLMGVAEQNRKIYLNFMSNFGPAVEALGAMGIAIVTLVVFGVTSIPIMVSMAKVLG